MTKNSFGAIKTISKGFNYDKKYQEFNQKYNYLDDGKAAKRVLEEIAKRREIK